MIGAAATSGCRLRIVPRPMICGRHDDLPLHGIEQKRCSELEVDTRFLRVHGNERCHLLGERRTRFPHARGPE